MMVLVRSPNASVANTLAGQITGLSSVQTSGQLGQEDPKVFIRGVGSLTESASFSSDPGGRCGTFVLSNGSE